MTDIPHVFAPLAKIFETPANPIYADPDGSFFVVSENNQLKVQAIQLSPLGDGDGYILSRHTYDKATLRTRLDNLNLGQLSEANKELKAQTQRWYDALITAEL